jgi:endonuclease YncB( thermonuclease family)
MNLSRWITLSAVLAAMLSWNPTARAADSVIRGRVVAISDGDTFTALDASKNQHKIRLYGIDAPEKSQAFGSRAKEHMSDLVFGKDVVVTVMDTDRYGRTVGKVRVAGVDVNTKMVRDGFAWRYVSYDRHKEYADAEAEARAAKRGLWVDKSSTPPWEFRKMK